MGQNNIDIVMSSAPMSSLLIYEESYKNKRLTYKHIELLGFRTNWR